MIWSRQNLMLAMAFICLGAIIGVLATKFSDQRDIVVTFLTSSGGTILGCIVTAFNYEWGSSRSSADKTAMLAKGQTDVRP